MGLKPRPSLDGFLFSLGSPSVKFEDNVRGEKFASESGKLEVAIAQVLFRILVLFAVELTRGSELLDNIGFSEEPSKAAAPAQEDIPPALREDALEPVTPPEPPTSQGQRLWLVSGIAGLGAIATMAVGAWFVFGVQLFPSLAIFPNFPLKGSQPSAAPTSPSPAITPARTPTSQPDTLLGHFPYPEAPAPELQAITADGRMKLRPSAAKQFQAMAAAARAQGILLVPISGFRSLSEQQQLFFEVKAQRNQLASERASVSAPPGYSEHHTGYAIDIGDGKVPATNLNPNFEQTAAFKWLSANAARFNFEISFPKNNRQGVSYEPWHWRFVGDRHSLEMFYKAKKLNSTPQ